MSEENTKGSTITGLLITFAIIVILSVLSVTMHRNQQIRARRSEAWVALQTVRAMEEQYREQNRNWTLSRQDLVSFGWPSNAGNAIDFDAGSYRITLGAHASGFTATAAPRPGTRQFNMDGGLNGWLAIDAEGNKTSGGGVDRWK